MFESVVSVSDQPSEGVVLSPCEMAIQPGSSIFDALAIREWRSTVAASAAERNLPALSPISWTMPRVFAHQAMRRAMPYRL